MSRRWRIFFAALLLALSASLYYLHYLIFKDAFHIFYYLLNDIAFVPISVLLVTLVLAHTLESKQKEVLRHKLNMVLGTFFSEVGNPLLRKLDILRRDNPGLTEKLQVGQSWTAKEFNRTKNAIRRLFYAANAGKTDLAELRDFLGEKRSFLLTLLNNPNLLEHDRITDMLWAIFHLTEELLARKDLKRMNPLDLEHLSGDIKRVYGQLVAEWLQYMQHLKNDYPYLFSLAVRTNPFNPEATPEIS